MSSPLSKRLPHMYNVQPGPYAYNADYKKALNSLYGDVRQLYSDSHLVHTTKTDNLIRDIGDEVAHLRLDNELLNGSSGPWSGKFPERDLVSQRHGLLRTTKHLTDPGGQLIARYQVNMDKGRMECNNNPCACVELRKSPAADSDIGVGWTDTNVRAAESWAINELSGLKNQLAPLANAAKVRTQQYLDWLGITDRYRGYRNNMGYHGRPDINIPSDSAIKATERPPMAHRWNFGIEEARAKAVRTTGYIAPEDVECERLERLRRNCKLKQIPEDPVASAGMNKVFPGKTEYQEGYIYPPWHDIPSSTFRPPSNHRSESEQPPNLRGRGSIVELDSERVRSKGYFVNPTPKYLGFWKPNDAKPFFDERLSETIDRFKCPDGKEIRTCPWENR